MGVVSLMDRRGVSYRHLRACPLGHTQLHTGDRWGPDHKVQLGCTQVGAKDGSTLGIDAHGIQKLPACGHQTIAHDDTSGRTVGRPARALVGQLLRAGVAVSFGSRL